MLNVLVTGGAGFVGRALCTHLINQDIIVKASVRESSADLPEGVHLLNTGDLNGQTDWEQALKSVDVVVHLAARVHVMEDRVADPLAAFRKTNVSGTLNLATQAAKAGVKRFIFISSIKVNGECTAWGKPFTADDLPNSMDNYAKSKLEAEIGLQQLALVSGMEMVIIRPPLVYGPGVKANFQKLMQYLDRGFPLPFGKIDNRRSLVSLANLVDIITICLTHPAAANQVFLVCDGEDVSTSELLRRLAGMLGKRVRLLPVPVFLLRNLLLFFEKIGVFERLCGNLQIDMSKTYDLLGWVPLMGLDEGLLQTAHAYLATKK